MTAVQTASSALVPSDATVILASNLVGEALQRDRPNLTAEAKFAALVRGVHLVLNAGAFEMQGGLYMPAEPQGSA